MSTKKSAHANIYIYLFLLLGIFLLLAGRLFYLQVINAEEYKTQSASNSMRLVTLPTKRGDILDINGEVLATSIPVASIVIDTNADEADYQMTIYNLAKLLEGLGYDVAKIEATIEAANKKGLYGSIEIIRIPYDDENGMAIIGKFYERAAYLTAASVTILPTRYYPQGTTLGTTVGYVGSISEEEYKGNEDLYSLNDIIGKAGLEKSMEVFKKQGTSLKGLLGTKGTQAVEIDSLGRTVAIKSTDNKSIPGDSLQLTIDLRLQRVMEDALDSQISISQAYNSKAASAAAIAINVNTGEILAMSSKPDLDPNDFIDGLSESEAEYYLENKSSPMLNKVTGVAYPPGSTFKMIIALAGLHYSGLTGDYTETCTGVWRDNIKCTGTHGSISMVEALRVSCNDYFQSFAEKPTIENIAKTARQFGLGVDTGFTDIPGVVKGFLPTPESKASLEKAYLEGIIKKITAATSEEIVAINDDNTLSAGAKKEKITLLEKEKEQSIANAQRYYNENKDWYIRDTDLVSIGQGLNNYSAMQLGEYISTIANGGTRYKPTIIRSITSSDGKSVYEVKPLVLNKVEMTPEEFAVIKAGMEQVTTSGTAATDFRGSGLSVAGKTGTAQTGRAGDSADNNGEHGLFVGYAPVDNPEIAIAVIIEYGRNSSSSAAQVAREVLEAYFSLKGM